MLKWQWYPYICRDCCSFPVSRNPERIDYGLDLVALKPEVKDLAQGQILFG